MKISCRKFYRCFCQIGFKELDFQKNKTEEFVDVYKSNLGCKPKISSFVIVEGKKKTRAINTGLQECFDSSL